MKNKAVKLVLGVVLLGVLIGGYVGVKSYVASQEEEEEEQEEKKTSVFETQTDSITSLKFMIDQKEVTFIKKEDEWTIEDEKEFPVDQDTLNNAASDISSVDADRVLENVEDLGEYGLDNPENTITISTDNDEDTVIRIGMKNESTSQYYVRKDDDKSTVYVVEESLISPFMNSLYDYAEMQTFPHIDSSTVSKVTVEQKENSYEAVKNENTGLWEIESDGESEKGDSAKFSSLTTSLGSLEYDAFVDYNCSDKGKYGLESPYAVVTIDYEEEAELDTDEEETDIDEETQAEESETEESEMETSEEEESETEVSEAEESGASENSEEESGTVETQMVDKEVVILVGNETDSDSRYVMIDGSKEVYTITNDLLSTVIDKDVSTMWDMTVNYLSVNDLSSLDVEFDSTKKKIDVSRETVAVENEEDTADESSNEDDSESEPETETVVTYKMDGEELDDIKFTTFYNKLINLVGQKRLTEDYHPEERPELAVVFHNLNNESVNVDFYEYDVNYYAAVVDNKVYLINKMTFKELRDSYEELLTEDVEEE